MAHRDNEGASAGRVTALVEAQRDLWVSYLKLANLAEKSGDALQAAEYWRNAHDTLAAMKNFGLHLSPQDEGFLARLKEKVGG